MNAIATYKQEIESALDLAQRKLIELREMIRGLSDMERLDSLEEVEALEKIADEIKRKVKELNQEMEDSWEQIRGDVESSKNRIDEAFARLNRSLV